MTRGPDPDFDPYKVLQVDPDADAEIIALVYRRLARKFHPDVSPGPEGAARMLEINRAMELLGDPVQREMLDRARADLGRSARPNARPGSEPVVDPAAAAGSPPRSGPGGTPAGGSGPAPIRPQTVSRDWTSGRSTHGGGYDPSRMRTADGEGAAGPPPGDPSGTVLNFGRYAGWSLGEIARKDLEYLEWLDRMAIGRAYRDEIDGLLRTSGRRRSSDAQDEPRGLFRKR
ncbi:MAG: DnaJ domain-containing protein [Chloroflexota bacterium]|nr:DnaJ domain-containing protein [Chloroflexota bacterium]